MTTFVNTFQFYLKKKNDLNAKYSIILHSPQLYNQLRVPVKHHILYTYSCNNYFVIGRGDEADY